MNNVAKRQKKNIEKLFLKAQMLNLVKLKNMFFSSKFIVKSPFQKIYLLKKMYSILYCLIENNSLKEKIAPELTELLKRSAKLYFYFFLEMETDFYKLTRRALLLLLCKHLSILIKKLSKSMQKPLTFSPTHAINSLFEDKSRHFGEISVKQRLWNLVDKFASNDSIKVSNTTILSGHDTTINTILTFLESEPFNIDKGYKRLKRLYNYPPRFGSNLEFKLEECIECSSGYRVLVKYDFKEMHPFFCQEKGKCDLLKFLEYIDRLEDFVHKIKENEFKVESLDGEF
jgi:hypothetical protein